ncbi:MAG: metallophosphoesterase [Thermoguttaceae bacterium]|nr:metallophosphoesterase [Thermoguttaceae bacterium]
MIRFGAIADLQYADRDDAIGRSYRASIGKFLEAAGAFAAERVPFVLQLGDATDGGLKNYFAVQELFAVSEKAGLVWRHVLGNHDWGVPDERKKSVPADFNAGDAGYYDFTVVDPNDAANRWRFVVLNGNEISEYAATTDEERAEAKRLRETIRLPNGSSPASWNGAVSDARLRWLDERLSDAKKNGEKAIVCSHFPLYAQSRSLQKRGALARALNLDIYFTALGVSTWNGPAILDVLDRHSCVKAFFAGHLHEGGFGVRKNVAHVTFNGVVEAPRNAFAFVELHSDRIVVEGRADQPSYEHKFDA